MKHHFSYCGDVRIRYAIGQHLLKRELLEFVRLVQELGLLLPQALLQRCLLGIGRLQCCLHWGVQPRATFSSKERQHGCNICGQGVHSMTLLCHTSHHHSRSSRCLVSFLCSLLRRVTSRVISYSWYENHLMFVHVRTVSASIIWHACRILWVLCAATVPRKL